MNSAIYEEWTNHAREEGYREGLEQGRREAREEVRQEYLLVYRYILQKHGIDRFGDSPRHLEMLNFIDDSDRLIRLITSVYRTHSWDELLRLP